ncbi:MAG: acyl-CoA synthetase FdrA [Burkholderiales bacterium]
MSIRSLVKSSLYKDSVALMRIAEDVQQASRDLRVTLLMGTPANKALLHEARLLADALIHVGPADLMIIVEAASDADCERALQAIDAKLTAIVPRAVGGAGDAAIPLRSIGMALGQGITAARIAQISVPGPYAAAEAMKALKAGMHAFVFSDNVPIEQEIALKQLAQKKGLLVMGPDCGTAIVAGVPMGFANVVRRGAIGLVAASGTGLQEVSTQIHQLGEGVSHAIGTGGRDLSEAVGGITMLAALDTLGADPGTRVLVVISKPPAARVTRLVLDKLQAIGKPAVVLFIGATLDADGPVRAASTLYDAAAMAVELSRGQAIAPTPMDASSAAVIARTLQPDQRFIRALYSGGTYCSEAQAIWRASGIAAYSNVPLDKDRALADPRTSIEHTALDLGDDAFTVGKPHPMIDPTTRIARIALEARDPQTALVLLDVVLGHGSHKDPSGALAPAISQALAVAKQAGRTLPILTFVCGTEDDPQSRSAQEHTLRAAGAIVLPNSTAAARFAAAIIGSKR